MLLAAVLACQAATAAQTWNSKWDGVQTYDYEEGDMVYINGGKELRGDIILNAHHYFSQNDIDQLGIIGDGPWIDIDIRDDDGTCSITGSGSITAAEDPLAIQYGAQHYANEVYLYLAGENVELGSGLTFDNIYICMGGDNTTIKSTIKNCTLEISGATVDITEATLQKTGLWLYRGSIKCKTLNVDTFLQVENDGYDSNIIDGNVSLGSLAPTTGTYWWEEKYDLGQFVQGGSLHVAAHCDRGLVFFNDGGNREYGFNTSFNGGSPSLTITGTLTVAAPTCVTFTTDYYCERISKSEHDQYVSTMQALMPKEDEALIVCGSITEASVNNLRPYSAVYIESWDDSSDDDVIDRETLTVKALTSKKFTAKAGDDGMVYIYLTDGGNWTHTGASGGGGGGSAPQPPPAPKPGISVSGSSTVVLGKDESTTPGSSNPVQMQGGTADASGLADNLLTNQIFQGNSGTVSIGDNQAMKLTGNAGIGYNIKSDGGNIIVGNGSDESNIELQGKEYKTNGVTVKSKAHVTINGKTTVGKDAGASELYMEKDASATNFGKVAADINMDGARFLNQGTVDGAVELSGKSSFINNGTMKNKLTVGNGASAFGSGNFADTLVQNGARLHVGNSPGYQKHNSLSMANGSTLSFSVDGVQAATAQDNGSGTHSQLVTEALAVDLNGKVNVNIEVTEGIVNAGDQAFDLVLLKAVKTENVTEDSFVVTINDTTGYLEYSDWSWSGNQLTMSGKLDEEIVFMLTSDESYNVANTMWGSTMILRDFVRTAETQAIIGRPGETTYWAGVFGTYLDTSDHGAGFTCNATGFAVGMQHAFTDHFRAGLSLGNSFGDFKSEDGTLDVEQQAIMPAFTAQYVMPLDKKSSLILNGHLAYATVENKAKDGTTWNDDSVSVGLRAGWSMALTEYTTIMPYIELTYQNTWQEKVQASYPGGTISYEDGKMYQLSMPIGVTVRSVYEVGNGQIFAPELTVSYISDIARKNPTVNVSNGKYSRKNKGYNYGRHGFMFRGGANWLMDANWSLGAYYTLETRSDQIDQSFNASVRYTF